MKEQLPHDPVSIDAELDPRPGERMWRVYARAIEIRKQKGVDVTFEFYGQKMIVRADLKVVKI